MIDDVMLISKMIDVGADQSQIMSMRKICEKLSKTGKKSKREIYRHVCLLIGKKANKIEAEQSMRAFLKS